MLNQRWQDNYRANKEGTENVYEAAASASVGRVVHISTFGVYRWHLGKPAFDETSPTLDGSRRQGGAYRATKQLSEQLAFEISRKHGIKTTALRPAGIYGARDPNNLPWFRLWFRLPVVTAPKFRFPFVYAGDISHAVAGALRNDASADKAYLTAGRSDTLYDFVKAYKEAGNKRSLVLGLPWPSAFGVHIDCTRAQNEIDFHNRSYLDGLRETFQADADYRAAGIA
jgi:nucleoside-diphosphate-sugar epimerase